MPQCGAPALIATTAGASSMVEYVDVMGLVTDSTHSPT